MNEIDLKCGEIFFSKSSVYFFVCYYCEDKFKDIETFQSHYEVFHFQSNNIKNEIEISNLENKTYEMVIEQYEVNSEGNTANIWRNDETIENYEKETNTNLKNEYYNESQNLFQENKILISNKHENVSKNYTCEQNENSENDVKDEIYCSHCDYQFKTFHKHDQQNCATIQKLIKNYRYKNHKYNYNALQLEGVFLCKNCPRYFDNFEELTFHENSHCTLPPTSIKKSVSLNSNSKTKHPNLKLLNIKTNKSTSNELFQCQYCDRQFVKNTAFLKHQLNHERSKCEYCGKLLKSIDKLTDHLRTHTGDRPFKCTKCPAAFAIKRNLSTHFIYKHTDDKPFKCTYEEACGKFFKTKHLRNLHEKRHSQNVEFQCEICGENFNVKAKLRGHFKRKHLDYSQRPHSCSICDKKFVDKQQLREHERTHTGEKPLKCDKCSSSFAKLSSLREHKKLHSGEKNHVCKICGKAFVQFAGYWSHMKNHP